MKVLFHSSVPFAFAHGGQQVQIVQTREALQKLGVEVEFLRWHDENQSGDLLHFFGRIPVNLLRLAHQKGLKVIVADLLAAQSARPASRLALQKLVIRGLERALPPALVAGFGWQTYREADACLAVTQREAQLMAELFAVPAERIHVVPNGVEEVFLSQTAAQRGRWLVCTATITEIKRVVELAQSAIHAQTPLWFIGKPYAESDPYARRFFELAKAHPQAIRYEGPIMDREKLAQIYREARGFVLLSAWESLSLSALEASACECPLLLSDLPWARSVFADKASYCPVSRSTEQTGAVLRKFYDAAPNLAVPPKPPTWASVAAQIKRVYEQLK